MSDENGSVLARDARDFDLVLWGATGFTGGLVAEYLAERFRDGGLRWALAGRDEGKLAALRARLGLPTPEAVPVLLANASDKASLRTLARATRVLLTTVGPYAKYGDGLVEACANEGTDYADLTGEVQWMRRTIAAHDAAARRTGARVVHTCGYDSIPSDLGTLAVQRFALEKLGAPCARVKHFAGETRGGVSGGTIASMLQLMEELRADPSLRRVLGDPYALDPPDGSRGPDRGDQATVRFDRDLGQWTAPFVMAAVNSRVVRRTHALLGYPWGRDFRYEECASTGRGAAGLARATGMTAGLVGALAAMQVPPARALLHERVLPKPGEGPSRETIEGGYFVSRLLGYDASGRPRVKVVVRGRRDPGYGATARMLAESGLCLLRDVPAAPGGIGTPASTMGERLFERLERAEVTFRAELL